VTDITSTTTWPHWY